MRRLGSTILLLLLARAAGAAEVAEPAPTSSPAVLDAAHSAAFADELLRRHDPFNALTFYRLAEVLEPEAPDVGRLRFRQALCYELGDRWAAAERAYLDVAGQHPELAAMAGYRAGIAALDAGRPLDAGLHLDAIDAAGDRALTARIHFLRGVAATERRDLITAGRELEAVDDDAGVGLIARAGAGRQVLLPRVRRVQAGLAGVLSAVVPGSGQLYAGHAADAGKAFVGGPVLGLWGGTLIAWGAQAERPWAIATGTALGSVAVFAWTANVLGAVRGARRANDRRLDRRAAQVLEVLGTEGLDRRPEDLVEKGRAP